MFSTLTLTFNLMQGHTNGLFQICKQTHGCFRCKGACDAHVHARTSDKVNRSFSPAKAGAMLLLAACPSITHRPRDRIRRTSQTRPNVLMHPSDPRDNESSIRDGGTIDRRNVLSAVVLSSLSCPQGVIASVLEDKSFPVFLDNLLRSSSVYAVKADSTKKASPSASQMSASRLIRALASKRAIFLGEHHPALQDHLLQAALLRRLCATGKPLAVGLEAVQRRFQPVLDDYIARRITEKQLFLATDWERRWYWSFEAYAPIFRICRERGVDLVALDVDSEDKAKVELGGLASLEKAKWLEYVPDLEGFERFNRTRAFSEYVSYTLKPPYVMMQKFGQKMTASTDVQRDMTFRNFLGRQSLRDEAMASASVAWLNRNPGGLLLGLVGVNHMKFACGVPARAARMLPGGLDVVASVLLNPTPAATFMNPNSLRFCDDVAVANEACLRNDVEVQNYVLQVPYASAQGTPDSEGRNPADQDEAALAAQARKGSLVLVLSDYMIFSPP